MPRNPLQRWTFGTENGSINEFAFSPCGLNLAIASQDGFLRVFRYDTMELLGIARSYFGGFLCVCWSPDGKYIVVGGEDDLVTVWSLHERRVVARGQGHRSWVSVVAFDPFTTSYASVEEDPDVSDDDGVSMLYRSSGGGGPRSTDQLNNNNNNSNNRGAVDEFYSSHNNNKMPNGGGVSSNINNNSSIAGSGRMGRRRDSSMRHSVSGGGGGGTGTTSYRLGSVSQDTQLCLWDITEDVLRPAVKPPMMTMMRQSTGGVHSPGTEKKGMRIDVKPYSTDTPPNAAGVDSSAGNGQEGGGGGGSTNGQTPVSSLSSISSSNNNNNNNTDKVDGRGVDGVTGAAVTTAAVAAAAPVALPSGSGNSKQQQQQQKATATTTISLIGNCVGNSVHKMTNSSSISSTSSSLMVEEVGGAATVPGAGQSHNSKAIGNGGKLSTDSGIMTLNAFTQRLSHFSFSNEKGERSNQNAGGGKKGFTLSKPFGGGGGGGGHNSISSERKKRLL